MMGMMLAALALSADPQAERIAEAIRLANKAAQVQPDSTKVVVVTVDATQWTATYKGQRKTWPRSTTAEVVEREAGAFGREVDTVRPLLPRLFSPPLIPVRGGS